MSVRYSVFCNDENKLVQGYTSGEPLTFCPNNVNHTIAANSVRLISNDSYLSPSSSAVQFRVVSWYVANRFWLILYPRGVVTIRDRVTGSGTITTPPTLRWMYRTRTTRLALDLRNEVGLSQGWLTTPLLGVDRRVFDWEPDGTFWLFDDTDGFIFEEQQFSLSYNVEAWRLLDSLNFNADQLDGQGPSGVVIDPNQGYIFAIRFSGYSVSFICGRRIWETENRRTSFYILTLQDLAY
jgi:hypothetical protein